jgi:diacylglycerol O-acyltransferase / wax synthase
MEQLPGSDALFLAVETDTVYGHVGGLTIVDPTDAPDFSFARLAQITDERIREVPRLTRKLRSTPFDLDRPYLVDDPGFDVEHHLRRIAVPSPGGLRELAEVAGHLYSRHLDRRKSLWEMWLIEGLERDRSAILMKTHHAIMDGKAGAGLAALLFDTEPRPETKRPAPHVPRSGEAREPGTLRLTAGGLGCLMRTPFSMARYGYQLGRQLRIMLPYLRQPEMPSITGIPQVSFNAPLGPQRALAWNSVPLAAVKRIKDHFQVKVNDVVLALAGSAVRHYLEVRGELPREPLVAGVPISTRNAGDASVGNQVTATSVSWATDLADPVERLLEIHKSATKAKEMEKAMRAHELGPLGEAAPPRLINLAFRALTGAGVSIPVNVAVSNVVGPPIELYTAGARIEHIYPMSVLLPGSGLNVTTFTYNELVDFGFTVDPELIPDAWCLAEAIPAALRELERCMR